MALNNSINANVNTPLPASQGGTGASNANSSTLTMAGPHINAGAFPSTFNFTASTNVTFPVSGTLATTAGTVSSATGTASQVLINGTSGVEQTGSLTFTTPQDIATTSSPTFNALTLAGTITGMTALNAAGGAQLLGFGAPALSVNSFQLNSSATGSTPSFQVVGSDTNINMGLVTKGTGQFVLQSTNTTSPVRILSGTGLQHSTTFAFANTAATRTVTFQDADGTVAYVGSSVSSATGTASQVLVSGTSGVPQVGALTFTLPQDIATTSSPQFSSLTLATASSSFLNLVGSSATALNTINAYRSGNQLVGAVGFGYNLSGAATGDGTVIYNNVAGGAIYLTLLGGNVLNMTAATSAFSNTVTAPSINFNTTSGIIGTTTNNNAAAGSVGEYIESIVPDSAPVSMTAFANTDLTFITLTPGDWDVWGNIAYLPAATTAVAFAASWIYTVSGNVPAAQFRSALNLGGSVPGANSFGVPAPSRRYSVPASTTLNVYLTTQTNFGVSTMSMCGGLYARRRR